MSLSVVVSTINRPKMLQMCLHVLIPQLAKEDELLVIGSINDPDTKNVILPFRELKNFESFKKPDSLSARNFGLKKSRGEVVAFLDDDCIVSPKWVQNIKRLSNKQADHVYQGQINFILPDNTTLSKIFLSLAETGLKFRGKRKTPGTAWYINFFHSEAFFLERDKLNKLSDFFGKVLPLNNGAALSTGLQLMGYKIVYEPKLAVVHYKDKITVTGSLFKTMEKGYTVGKLEKKYGVGSKVKKIFGKYFSGIQSSSREKDLAGSFLGKGIVVRFSVLCYLYTQKIFFGIGRIFGKLTEKKWNHL